MRSDYNFLKIYGISQNPNTKDYIVIFNDEYFCIYHCKNCGELYTNIQYKWCKTCQINYIKENFVTWISGNDNFTQKIQLKNNDMEFKWISYDQFNSIKEAEKNNFASILHSVIWKDDSLIYDSNSNKYEICSNNEFALKCLYNIQDINNKVLLNHFFFYKFNQNSRLFYTFNKQSFILQ
jgi:hypothetical protein